MLLLGRLPRSSITYRAVRFRPATSNATARRLAVSDLTTTVFTLTITGMAL